MIVAIADMAAIADLSPDHLASARDVISTAGLIILDGNLRPDTFAFALDLADGVRTVVEPVSAPKAALIADALDARVFAVTPNRDELEALTGLPTRTKRQVRVATSALHDRGVELVWVTLGARGSLVSTGDDAFEIPAIPADVDDVTGAGDSMIAAFSHALLQGGSPLEAARLGHAAAALTIASPHTVRPDLTPRLLQAALTTKDAP
jgi:pseudouridine kinase